MSIENLLENLDIAGNIYAQVAVGALILAVLLAVIRTTLALVLRRRRSGVFPSELSRRRGQHGKPLRSRWEKGTHAAMSTLTEEELRGPPKTMTIWIEMVPREGQDSPPVVMLSEDGQFGVLGVFDGMGGRGGTKYTFRDGTYAGWRLNGTYAGAWLAARYSADTLVDYVEDAENWMRRSRAAMQPSPEHHMLASASHVPDAKARETRELTGAASEARATASVGDRIDGRMDVPIGAALSVKKLGEWFDQGLRQLAEELPTSEAESRVRAKVIRKLPTTIAAASFEVAGDMLDVRTFWAGDSRCYYLSENGLAQLTADDTKLNPDSWESLSQDAPLTNYLSEEKNQLREAHFRLPLPGLLICCSDGAWGFVGSPMHLEELLLYTVTDKLAAVDAVRRLAEHFRSVAGDDVSLIMHPVGFQSLYDMQAHFASRRKRVSKGYVEPLDEAADRLEKAKTHKLALDGELEKQKRAIEERLERRKEELETQKREAEERAAKDRQGIERRAARDKHKSEAELATAQEDYNRCLQTLWGDYKVNYYDSLFHRGPK